MLQRIQTIYLLLTMILAVLFLAGTILIFSSATGDEIIIKLSGIYSGNSQAGIQKINVPVLLTIILLMIPVISVITILIYKNRKLQMKFNLALIILILFLIFLIFFYVFTISSEFSMNLYPGLKLVLPLLMVILSVFSYSAIKKDDDLVKSYDHLR